MFDHFMHSLGIKPMTSALLYWIEYSILTLVLSFSPVAERTGGNDPVLRSTLRDGANIPLAGCAGITKAEENNLHTTAPRVRANEAYGRGLELTFLPSYPSFREFLIPSEHSCINKPLSVALSLVSGMTCSRCWGLE